MRATRFDLRSPGQRLLVAGGVALALHGGAAAGLMVGGAVGGAVAAVAADSEPVQVDVVEANPVAGALTDTPASHEAQRAGSVVDHAAPVSRRPRARLTPPARVAAGPSREVVDLTGSGLIAGRPAASGSAGPANAPTGASAPGAGAAASGALDTGRARPVGLSATDWRCPWPADAEAGDKVSETVVIEVVVEPNGRARAVTVTADPGFGFGAAAKACALGTHFLAARDHDGRAITARSPPIRVRFTR
jgi:protein TonB